MAAWFDYLFAQIAGTFLASGSTLSVSALLITLTVAVLMMGFRRRSRRSVRLRVMLRALFPRRLWRSASGRSDIGWFLFSLFAFGPLVGWAIWSASSVASAVHGLAGDTYVLSLPAMVAVPLATLVVFFAYEFAYWLDHMLSHRIKWLWQFHRVHHTAESLSLLTNFRVHPIDTIVFYNIVAVIVGVSEGLLPLLLGPEAKVFSYGSTNIVIFVAAVLITHVQHSHIWVTFGPKWGKWFFSPAHHQIHHSSDPAHHDSNFGSTLTVFDRLYGSFIMPGESRGDLRFGVDDMAAQPHGFAEASYRPFARALAVIVGSGFRPREFNQIP